MAFDFLSLEAQTSPVNVMENVIFLYISGHRCVTMFTNPLQTSITKIFLALEVSKAIDSLRKFVQNKSHIRNFKLSQIYAKR